LTPLVSHDPATGEELGRVEATAPEAVAQTVARAAQAQPLWAALRPVDRGRYLRRAAQAIIDDLPGLGELLAREAGRPRTEALATELVPSIQALHWLAAEGPGELAERRLGGAPRPARTRRAHLAWEPAGVAAVIWSAEDPWAMPLVTAAAALMAGNGVVLRPDPAVCLLGERIDAVLGAAAGLPEGLLGVVHGGAEAEAALRGAPVGAVRMAACPPDGTPDAMVVLDDAPLEHAVRAAAWAAFANAGRGCGRLGRVYVVREVAARFVEGLVARARDLAVGDPRRWSTEVGPLAGAEQRAGVAAAVERAVAAGAHLRCGGTVTVPGLAGAFYAPAVLTGVTGEMAIAREPVTGPVVAVVVVGAEEEAVALAGDPAPAVGASVWTRDEGRGERVARRLRAGAVWVNDHAWPGASPTALGVELRACARPAVVATRSSRLPAAWWHPHDRALAEALGTWVALLYGREADRPAALRAGAGPLARVAARLARDAGRS
jgi:acyl-CoA reductase-like NAD-dependent aldehyde dehydrogenase